MSIKFGSGPFAIASKWVQLSARRSETNNLMATELEREFVHAYQRRHGSPIREFARVDAGQYRINGIIFSETQVNLMLDTLNQELVAQRNVGLVKRLIRYFGGKRD